MFGKTLGFTLQAVDLVSPKVREIMGFTDALKEKLSSLKLKEFDLANREKLIKSYEKEQKKLKDLEDVKLKQALARYGETYQDSSAPGENAAWELADEEVSVLRAMITQIKNEIRVLELEKTRAQTGVCILPLRKRHVHIIVLAQRGKTSYKSFIKSFEC